MKKKISAILVVVVLFFALSPPQVYAQSVESIHYDDGSYILIEKECSSQKRRRLVLKVAVNSINIIRRLTNCNG